MKNSYHSQQKILSIIFFISILMSFPGLVSSTSDNPKFVSTKTYTDDSTGVLSVAWSHDEHELASVSNDGLVKIWNISTNKILHSFTIQTEGLRSVAWSPDGQKLASASEASAGVENTIKIWDRKTGVNIETIDLYNDYASSLAWNPNGSVLASGNTDSTIRLYNIPNTSGFPFKIFHGHTRMIFYLSWSHDSNTIISAAYDYSVRFWNSTTGENLKTFSSGNRPIEVVSWSPDETRIAIDVIPNNLYSFETWDANNGSILNYLIKNTDPIRSVAWSPNGSMLASGSADNIIRIWNTKTWINFQNLTNHTGGINSVAWSLDGTKIASGSDDCTVKIWEIPKPNVYIKSFDVDRTKIFTGENINITAVIINDGTADASNVSVKFYDGTTLFATNIVNISNNSTKSIIHLWMTTNATPIDAHILQVVLGTNEMNITVTVYGKPYVYIKNLVIDRTNVTVGEIVNITATIANNGTADALNIDINFTDGTNIIGTRIVNVPHGGVTIVNVNWNTKHAALGKHTIEVVAGTSIKKKNVNIKRNPIILTFPVLIWIVILIIIIVIIISIVLGCNYHRIKKRRLE